jgi:hypothetical protein
MSPTAERSQIRAEVLKLARLLGRQPDQVDYLEQLSLEDLCELRERITEVLWNAHGSALNRLASASKLLPSRVSATISERAFGPLLTARMAALLDPERAVDVATKLSLPFLADVAIELDPRHASEVIARIPPRQISDITRELVSREEYVTMGRFVGHLRADAIVAALDAMDDRALLQIGFVLEDKERLQQLVALLPKPRLMRIVQAAADGDLWVEALDLLGHLTERQRSEIAGTTLELDHASLEAIVAVVIEHDLWQQVLVVAEYDTTLQHKLAERLPALPAGQRKEIARRARETGAIDRLGALGEALTRVRARA